MRTGFSIQISSEPDVLFLGKLYYQFLFVLAMAKWLGMRKGRTTVTNTSDRRLILSGHKRCRVWPIAALPVAGVTNTDASEWIYARNTDRLTCRRCIAVVLKNVYVPSRSCALIIMRWAYSASDDGGPTWRYASCAYSFSFFDGYWQVIQRMEHRTIVLSS